MPSTLDCFTLNVLRTHPQEPTVLFSVRTLATDLKHQGIVWGAESESFRWSQVKDGVKISFDQGVPALGKADLSLVRQKLPSLSLNPEVDAVRFTPLKSNKLNIKQFKSNGILGESNLEDIHALFIDIKEGSLWVERDNP